MIDALVVILGLGLMVLLGDAATAALRPALARESGSARLGLALLLGPGLVAFATFLLDLAGLRLGRPASVAAAALAALAFVASRRAARSALAAPRPDPAPDGVARLLAAATLVPLLLAFAFSAALPPVKDSLANWSLKTLVLFEDGTVRTPYFTAKDHYLFHPSYPLLVPLAEVFLYGLRGEVMDRLAKVVLPMHHLGAVLLLHGFVATRLRASGRGTRLAFVFAFLLAALPHFYRTDHGFRFAGSAPSGYAEAAFAALALGAALMSARWVARRDAGDGAAAGLLLALAVFTKNEGLPLALALGGGIVLAVFAQRLRGTRWPRVGEIWPALLLCAIVAVPWLLFRATIPTVDEAYQQRLLDPKQLGEGMWRTPVIVVLALQQMLASENHALVWPLLGCALVVFRRRLGEGEVLLLGTVLAAMIAVYYAVFVVTPLPIVDSLVTSIPRTTFHVGPIALLLTACLVAGRDAREEARS